MSRKATNEYIGTKRRAYAQADRAKRMRILDEVCETTGYERKYANRLRPFRMTRAPSSAAMTAQARPMPDDAPVTKMRLPRRSTMFFILTSLT